MKLTFTADTLPEIVLQMTNFIDFAYAQRQKDRAVEISSLAPPEDTPVPLEDLMVVAEDEAKAKADAEPEPAPKATKPKATKPKPAAPAPEVLLKDALSRLMVLYNVGGDAQTAVKELLKVYGVRKFSEIPVEKAQALFDDVIGLEAQHQVAAA